MDILAEETKKKMSTPKKVILICLVIAIIALIISVLAIMTLKEKEGNQLRIYIDQNELSITENTLINENEVTYISLNKVKFVN